MNYWKHLFSSAILSRGFSYYRLGNVRDLSRIREGYRAFVSGSGRNDYLVEIRFREDTPSSMTCTCPFSDDGNNCKHMAAVLYALEAREKDGTLPDSEEPASAPNPRRSASPARTVRTATGWSRPINAPAKPASAKLIHPFRDKSAGTDSSYRYFDFRAIGEDLEILDTELEQAKKFIENRSVILSKPETAYLVGDDSSDMLAVITGSLRKSQQVEELQIILAPEKLKSYRCDSCGCYSYYAYDRKKKLCPHLLALLLLTAERFSEDDPGDRTDYAGSTLLRSFRHETAAKPADGKGTDIRLIPRLEIRSGVLNLSFRAGAEKVYVLKDLTDFAEAVTQKKAFSFGKSLSADFSKDRIAPESAELFSFLSRCTAEEQLRNEQLRERYPGLRVKDIGSSIPLFSHRLDDLCRLLPEKGITLEERQSERKPRVVELIDATPLIRLLITKQQDREGIFQGIMVTGDLPDRFEGAAYDYYPDEAYLVRSPKKHALEALYNLKAPGKPLSFRIGRRNLSDFYRKLLPALREVAEVHTEEQEFIESYIPSEPAFTFYLDVIGDRILCKAEVSYRDRTYSALDCLRQSFPDRLSRLPDRETEVSSVLLSRFPEQDLTNDLLWADRTDDLMYGLLNEGLSELRGYGEIQATDRFRAQKIRRNVKVSVGVSVKSGIMELSVQSPDLSIRELSGLLASYREKKVYHRLSDGSFVSLEDSAAELSELMEELDLPLSALAKKSLTLPAYRAVYLDKLLEKNDSLYVDRDTGFRNLIRSFKTVNESDFELPSSLTGTLRNYQVYGYRWLRTLDAFGFGGILADDMGLGKTFQVIACLTAWKAPGKTALIVTPASLVYNWMEEFRKFSPTLLAAPVAGSQKEREEIIASMEKYDVLVTSYDLLKRDIGLYDGLTFSCEIIDEAQYIKNHTTAAAKSVKAISAGRRFALTGTPIENRLSELWSIFDFLMPGFLYSYEDFRENIETPIAKHEDEEVTKRLRDMISPFILRRLKKDVLKDLPDKLEETRYARFSGEQQKLYDARVLSMKDLLDETDDESFRMNRMKILAELTKIRQICCDPGLLYENYGGPSAKREACLELVEAAIEGGHRILLFSQFTSMLSLLEQDLTARGIPFYIFTGSTPKKTRMELIRAFNEGDTPVFLISLKAGGTGINLTSADIVIHYDPWWNAAAENQATDRAHRIGQEKVVSVYRLIVKDTIEEKIQELQETKKALADAVLSGEGADLTAMTREDLMRLLC